MTYSSVIEPGATAGGPLSPVKPSPTVIMAAAARHTPRLSPGLETQV
jgi:hypothetical protein